MAAITIVDATKTDFTGVPIHGNYGQDKSAVDGTVTKKRRLTRSATNPTVAATNYRLIHVPAECLVRVSFVNLVTEGANVVGNVSFLPDSSTDDTGKVAIVTDVATNTTNTYTAGTVFVSAAAGTINYDDEGAGDAGSFEIIVELVPLSSAD